MYRIHNSPFGWALRSIRENPTRAEFIGINVTKYRLVVFTMSAFFSGIAGALFVYFLRYANPSYAGFVKSGEPLFAILVGGTQSFIGPAFGGVLLILLHWAINRVTEYWLFVMGAILTLVVLFFPEGMIGYLSKTFGKAER
jgi:branched-chain amino acid transport system permease protein